jgi:hypothetical protein
MQAQEDIETIIYTAGISKSKSLPQLADIVGMILSGTPFAGDPSCCSDRHRLRHR